MRISSKLYFLCLGECHVEWCQNLLRTKMLLPPYLQRRMLQSPHWPKLRKAFLYKLEMLYQFPIFSSIAAILCVAVARVIVSSISVIKAHSKFQQASIKCFPPSLGQYILRDQRHFYNPKFSEGEVGTNTHVAVKNSFAKTQRCR